MEPNLNKYKTWLKFLKKVRSFFEEEGFLEVKTPSLVPSGAMEAQLDAFQVNENLYLPTSPEFALKKLWLSGDFGSIFEISPSFRDNEIGLSHLSEFTMLEFYKENEDLEYLKMLIRKLFSALNPDLELLWGDVCLSELFKTCTGFKLRPDSNKDFLKKVCLFHNIHFSEEFSWNDLYQLIFINLLEPSLFKGQPLFVRNYPPQIAALAKINKDGWADRLEVFYKGFEIGNGYNELFDSAELLKRWSDENKERVLAGKNPHPVDETLIKAHKDTKLQQGVGIALGLERLSVVLEKSFDPEIKKWPFG